MRLRKPCEHGKYDRHQARNFGKQMVCPGGEFLPEGALWYCTTHRAAESAEEGTCEVAGVLWNLGKGPLSDCNIVKGLVVLDALASQVGESKQWRPIGETKWRDGTPPSRAEMYEVRNQVGESE